MLLGSETDQFFWLNSPALTTASSSRAWNSATEAMLRSARAQLAKHAGQLEDLRDYDKRLLAEAAKLGATAIFFVDDRGSPMPGCRPAATGTHKTEVTIRAIFAVQRPPA